MKKNTTSNILLAIDRISNFKDKKYCRFGMFVRLRPGIISRFKDQQRTWYYRGDKYTSEEPKMLKALLNHYRNDYFKYDRVIIYDRKLILDDQEILKIVDDVIHINALCNYRDMLVGYPIPTFLK